MNYTAAQEIVNEDEDWAIIPFDEREDDERWAKLIDEMRELEVRAAELEAVHGELLMEEELPTRRTDIDYEKSNDELLAEIDPF